MSNTSKFWIPAGSLSQEQALVLAVPTATKPDRWVHKHLLEQKFQHLINLLPPREAQDVMEMSHEHLPELYLIAKNQFPREWGAALTNSDTVHIILSQVDWSLPGRIQNLPEQDLQSLLEQMP